MRTPLCIRPLTADERETLEAGLRSSKALTIRRCQLLLASAEGQPTTTVARSRRCHAPTVRKAINLLEQGAEIVSIRELLGHASISSSERYAKASNQKVKQEYLRTMKNVLQRSKV